jgi:hypothetical protein
MDKLTFACLFEALYTDGQCFKVTNSAGGVVKTLTLEETRDAILKCADDRALEKLILGDWHFANAYWSLAEMQEYMDKDFQVQDM